VLVGSEGGRVWLHDLTGSGPGVEYVLPAEAPSAGVAITGRALPPGTRSRGGEWFSIANLPERYHAHIVVDLDHALVLRLRPGPQVDEDVRFTVYRPQVLYPEHWASLLVFAHKTTPVVEPGRVPADPVEEV
jgi:hypothetical protein